MRYSILCLLVIFVYSTSAVYRSCGQPSSYCGRPGCTVWYVDPQVGSMQNNGTLNSPWRTLQEVLSNNLIDRKQLTIKWDGTYPLQNLTRKYPTAPIKEGDVIALRSGWHGNFSLVGAFNAVPITIVGDIGHVARIESIKVSALINWNFLCVHVGPAVANSAFALPITSSYVDIQGGYFGPVAGILVENITIHSVPSLDPYRNNATALNGVLGDGLFVRNAWDITIRGNYIENTKRGFTIASPYTYVENNIVNYLSGDCFRNLQNHTVFDGNECYNLMGSDSDHRDFLQFFTNPQHYVMTNVTVKNSIVHSGIDPNRPFPDGCQGITGFDNPLQNIRIINNLLIDSTYYHGVAMMESQNITVIGNTIISLNTSRNYWISFQGFLNNSNSLVMNNIVKALQFVDGATLLNNTLTKYNTAGYDSVFRNFSAWDFRPRSNASFVGAGNTGYGAPTTDITGKVRVAPYDQGAYDYDASDTAPMPARYPRRYPGLAVYLTATGTTGAGTTTDTTGATGAGTTGASETTGEEVSSAGRLQMFFGLFIVALLF